MSIRPMITCLNVSVTPKCCNSGQFPTPLPLSCPTLGGVLLERHCSRLGSRLKKTLPVACKQPSSYCLSSLTHLTVILLGKPVARYYLHFLPHPLTVSPQPTPAVLPTLY